MPDLRALHRTLATLASADVGATRATAVLVPSRSAAEELRRTLENLLLIESGAGACCLPDLLTRHELYAALHEQAAAAPRLLSAFEREVLLRSAARAAERQGLLPPFHLRPALVAEILTFYDELRRRGRTLDDFDRLMTAALEPSCEIDRGAERLLRQTRFLAEAVYEFERRVAATGATDEHGLRSWLLTSGSPTRYRHVVVTVADQAADPFGLWPADFDLLARLPGLERLDVCATEHLLATGFHQRLHDFLPGIVEEQVGPPSEPPTLVVPSREGPEEVAPWFVLRDREEELAAVVRLLRDRGAHAALERFGVVFQRPLPYVYLAREVFADGQVPYQALDALPLAAEPFAAAVDLVFETLVSEATRTTLTELLASPHWRFDPPGELPGSEVVALDALLRDEKYLGGWDVLERLAAAGGRPTILPGARALQAAVVAARAVRAIADAPTAQAQCSALLAFLRDHERQPPSGDAWHERHLRARAAVLAALEGLRAAHAAHDPTPLPAAELAGTVRRWIEGQTFSPRTGTAGVLLADARAAAFMDADELRLVGLVEHDWPERTARSIFYPAGLLADLGWDPESERLAGARARFQDLLRLPRRRISLSTFTLEDDAIVAASPLLEELHAVSMAVERQPAPRTRTRDFLHEALMEEPCDASVLSGTAAGWAALRAGRAADRAERFQGAVGPREPATYAVSSLERYLECPFKYFAAHVMRLPEERDEEPGLSPRERGHLVHEVFHDFFAEWQAAGRRAVTMRNLEEALALFESVVERTIGGLPESERAVERTHLLGSAVAPGLGERAFAFEIEQDVEVVERLFEHALEGTFDFETADGSTAIRLRAKADRIDLLADGTLRVVDYKIGRAPKAARALQLPVYSVCARQQLEGRHGRSWRVGQAGYVAFREPRAFAPLGGTSGLTRALAEGQARLVSTAQAIERGEFPPDPDEPFLCTRCSYSTVCRKDYVGDE